MRQVNEQYLRMIRQLPCVCCAHMPSEGHPNDAAHIRYADAAACKPITGVGTRPDDKWSLPLCHDCHMNQHDRGAERIWWEKRHLNPIRICQELWDAWYQADQERLSWPRKRERMLNVIIGHWSHV
jgi:hypothetical protein